MCIQSHILLWAPTSIKHYGRSNSAIYLLLTAYTSWISLIAFIRGGNKESLTVIAPLHFIIPLRVLLPQTSPFWLARRWIVSECYAFFLPSPFLLLSLGRLMASRSFVLSAGRTSIVSLCVPLPKILFVRFAGGCMVAGCFVFFLLLTPRFLLSLGRMASRSLVHPPICSEVAPKFGLPSWISIPCLVPTLCGDSERSLARECSRWIGLQVCMPAMLNHGPDKETKLSLLGQRFHHEHSTVDSQQIASIYQLCNRHSPSLSLKCWDDLENQDRQHLW